MDKEKTKDFAINISEKEIERCLEEKVDDYCIPQGSGFDLVLPVIGLFVPALIFLLKQHETYGSNTLIGIVLALCIVALIAVIVLPLIVFANKMLVSDSKKLQEVRKKNFAKIDAIKENQSIEFERLADKQCLKCVSVKSGNVLNAYNLYTYQQILDIEDSVGKSCDSNKVVYSYSTYRDDGEDVGIAEAEKIIEENQRRGVKYYEFFFADNNEITFQLERNKNEIFINLEEYMGKDEIAKCLDYQFYKHSRFDIMIYQWSKDRIEGYYCINFPVISECKYSTVCPLNCTLSSSNRTAKVFYKKMPRSITYSLHKRLQNIVENKQRM